MSKYSSAYAALCAEQRREIERAAERARQEREAAEAARQAELEKERAERAKLQEKRNELSRARLERTDAFCRAWRERAAQLQQSHPGATVPTGHELVSTTADIFGWCSMYHPNGPTIVVPDDFVSWDADWMTGDSGVRVELLLEHWELIPGLDVNMPGNHIYGQLAISVGGQIMVPLAGSYSHDFPVRVREGVEELGECWRPFPELFRGFLAFECREASWGQHLDRGSWSFIRIEEYGERKKWWYHHSLAGLQDLLALVYIGQEGVGAERLRTYRQEVVELCVPKEQAGLWIGAQGSQVNRIAANIGVERVNVIPI